jgi:hypothetical protein
MTTLVTDAVSSSEEVIGVDYQTLLADLHGGDRIVVGDGAITLAVERITTVGAECEVRSGGHVQGRPASIFRRSACESRRRRPRTCHWPWRWPRGRRLPRCLVRARCR